MRQAEGFAAFVAAHRKPLLRSAWLLTGDWHAAEDLVQLALTKSYPHWPRIATHNPAAYVRRVMFTSYASSWRRRWRGEVPTEHLPEVAERADEFAESDQRRVVFAALRSLAPKQRATIVLRYYEDLSEAETAALLGCTVGTVKSQTAKALAQLRSNRVLLETDPASEVAHD